MPFYTFLMDFEGGTYISQITASSERAACRKWAKDLKVSAIYGFGIKSREILINEIETEEIVMVENLKNVWCVSVLIRKRLALTTFVKTEFSNNEQLTTNN